MSKATPYKVALSQRATRFFEKAATALQRKLDRCFDQLKHDPRRHPNIKALSGRFGGYFRYRVGDYRVVYAIDEPSHVIYIIMISHRREEYE